jgi:hypothetical protein
MGGAEVEEDEAEGNREEENEMGRQERGELVVREDPAIA